MITAKCTFLLVASIDKNGKFFVKLDEEEVETFAHVVNCTWQNVEYLNAKLGIGDGHFRKHDPQTATTLRLKLLAEVSLSKELKHKHSMFFCFGPHAMFSNLGNGIGRITYAKTTNFDTTTEAKISENWNKWLDQGLSSEEKERYGKEIIAGVAKYIPEIIDTNVLNVLAGIVISKSVMR